MAFLNDKDTIDVIDKDTYQSEKSHSIKNGAVEIPELRKSSSANKHKQKRKTMMKHLKRISSVMMVTPKNDNKSDSVKYDVVKTYAKIIVKLGS